MENTNLISDTQLANKLYFLKPILTLEEACAYTGISKSKMYKHTSSGNITHFKPEGKHIYFKTTDLNDWLLRGRTEANHELDRRAAKASL